MTIIDLRNELNSMIECGFGERILEPRFNIWDYIRNDPHPFPIVDGDIFKSGADIIAHQVNCQGVMGSGIAKQVREKFPRVFEKYKEECDTWKSALLGECLLVSTEKDAVSQVIANLFGQDRFGYDGKCYTDYEKLRRALWRLRRCSEMIGNLRRKKVSIAIPYLMGCHRGGGDWEIVSKMIEEELTACDVTLYRYTGG